MSKREEIRQKRRQKQRQQRLVLMLVIFGVALIVVAFMILPDLIPESGYVIPEFYDRPNANWNAMGDPNAPVVMEDYSDFLCSACKHYHDETEQAIIDEYVATGQLYVIYKPFPLGDVSYPPSEASFCAAEQGKFWEYHDILFANQSQNQRAYSISRLNSYADSIGLDVDEFETCMREDRYIAEIENGQQEGVSVGVGSTPSFLINGKLHVGSLPFTEFQRLIEAELAAAGSS